VFGRRTRYGLCREGRRGSLDGMEHSRRSRLATFNKKNRLSQVSARTKVWKSTKRMSKVTLTRGSPDLRVKYTVTTYAAAEGCFVVLSVFTIHGAMDRTPKSTKDDARFPTWPHRTCACAQIVRSKSGHVFPDRLRNGSTFSPCWLLSSER
jgi:hypothetical protein